MKTLAELFEGSGSDKGTVHSYVEVYEEVLAPYRDTKESVIELGILRGDSLRVWEKYFHDATVWGVDLNDHPLGGTIDLKPFVEEGTHHVVFADAKDREAIQQNFSHVRFDVVIDDASHHYDAQIAAYWNFRPLMNPGGVYIIEDIQDVEFTGGTFSQIDPDGAETKLLDRRDIKNRYDDVLAIIKIK